MSEAPAANIDEALGKSTSNSNLNFVDKTIQDMKNKISGMKKPDMIKTFIKEKAVEWKNIMHTNCITLTKIYEGESVDSGLAALEARFAKIDGQYQSVFKATNECTQSIKQADEESERIDLNKPKFQADLVDLSTQVKQKKAELKKFEQEIDEKTVSKIYKLLDKKHPEALGKMAEAMIALLRGQNNANSNDVELYLKNYQGLMYKMQRVDPALIPEECINLNENKLQALIKSFTESDDKDFPVNSQFVHMFAWSMNFANVCKFSRKVKYLEDKIEEGIKRKAYLAEQKIRYQACLEDLEMFELEKIQEERDIIEAILDANRNNAEQKKEQMEEVQQRYTEYEADFFAQVNAAKRQSKVSGV